MKTHYISYPGHGIGKIIETKRMNDVDFLSIEMLGTGLKIMVPKKSKGVYRELMDAETAAQVKDLLQIPNNYQGDVDTGWNRRYRKLMEKITSNNPILMAQVVAELNNRKLSGTELTFGERKMFDSAHTLLKVELELIGA